MCRHFVSEQWIAADLDRVFRVFADPRNLPLISPPQGGVRLVSVRLLPPPGVPEGEFLAGPGSDFNYFIAPAVFDYIVQAVRIVARDGWRLLGDYRFDPATGLWRHRHGLTEPPLRLTQVGYGPNGEMRYPHHDDRAASPS